MKTSITTTHHFLRAILPGIVLGMSTWTTAHCQSSPEIILQKISDAIEGGTDGRYRVSLNRPVHVSEDIVISFSYTTPSPGAIEATPVTDFSNLPENIVIPAGSVETIIAVDAGNDGIIEGPETVGIQLTGATSTSQTYPINPLKNSATVLIIDANAASSTPIQVITGTNASEPGTGATFTVKLAGVATSAWPVKIAYFLSGTANGADFNIPGEIVVNANTNSVSVPVTVFDDHVVEPIETITFTLLSGSATDGGGNAFIFPPDPANNDITVNIADDDNINRVLSLTKIADAAEPATSGKYRLGLPGDYVAASNVTAQISASGTALPGTDYTASATVLPAYQNFVDLNIDPIDDLLNEGTESVILTVTGGVDGSGLTYTAASGSDAVTISLADNDRPPVITGQPANSTICSAGNTSFSVTASNASSYQWQVNTGIGFNNIADAAPYSGATTASLTITGATGSMNGYQYQCVATGSATPAALSNAATLTVSSPTASIAGKTDVSCYGGANGSATVNVSGGFTPYTYSWSPSGGTAAIATGLAANTYTCTVTDNIGCFASAQAEINQPLLYLAPTSKSVSSTQGSTTIYHDCNDLIARVQATGASPVSGTVEARVWVESTQPRQFVKRHYEITPASNAASATGRVTLYFTQNEFAAFNLTNPDNLLPTDTSDAARKANLLIEKRGGTGGTNGLPGDYTGSITTIDPADENIVWNPDENRWEVTIDVTGFSGFFVKTISSPLPVKLISFEAKALAGQAVELKWQTAREIDNDRFVVERSKDLVNFEQVAEIRDVAGNSDARHNYKLVDHNPYRGTSYYRLIQYDLGGARSVSRTVSVVVRSQDYSLYPNPLTGRTFRIGVDEPHSAVISLYNTNGEKVAFQSDPEGSETLIIRPAQPLTGGIYMISVDERATRRSYKLIVE